MWIWREINYYSKFSFVIQKKNLYWFLFKKHDKIIKNHLYISL